MGLSVIDSNVTFSGFVLVKTSAFVTYVKLLRLLMRSNALVGTILISTASGKYQISIRKHSDILNSKYHCLILNIIYKKFKRKIF